MIDLNHIIDFAASLPPLQPHPSDIGLIKPQSGFALVPALFGVIAILQVSSFHWYAREKNEPTSGWGLDTDSGLFSYRWKQFAGVQILAIIVASSVMLAGPEKIFFPLGLK